MREIGAEMYPPNQQAVVWLLGEVSIARKGSFKNVFCATVPKHI